MHTCKRYLLKNDIQSSYNFTQIYFFVLFSPNPIEKPTRLTPVGTRNTILDSEVVPDELSPARPAGRAGWPSLAGPGWPARPPGPACRPVGCSAGGGGGRRGQGKGKRQRAGEPRPPTPITAGGLFHMFSNIFCNLSIYR